MSVRYWQRRVKQRVWKTVLLACCLLLLSSKPVLADAQCWINGAVNMNFGTTSVNSPTYVHNNLNYTCQAPYDASGVMYHFRVCVFVQADSTGNVNPRNLKRWDGTTMNYNLYSDPARTLMVGSTNSNDFPIDSWSIDVAPNTQFNSFFTLYGEVPARQGGLSAGTYESHFAGGILRWRWSKGMMPTPTEEDCQNNSGGSGGDNVSFFLNVTANALDSCLISSATDLDFGGVENKITANLDQIGSIVLRCPQGASWRLSLNNGLNPLGSVRRMAGPYSSYVTYGLYRDAARTLNWGQNSGVDTVNGTGAGQTSPVTVPVYGRVPAQSGIMPGYYSDQVTVTLTY